MRTTASFAGRRALVAAGLCALVPLLAGVALRLPDIERAPRYSLARHVIWLVVGVVLASGVAAMPTLWLRRSAWPVALASCAAMLAAPHLHGLEWHRGAPLAILALVVVLGAVTTARTLDVVTPREVAIDLVTTWAPLAMALALGDAQAACVALAVSGSVALLRRSGRVAVLVSLAGLPLAAPIFWRFVMAAHQRARVLAWLSPEASPHGAGYAPLHMRALWVEGGLFGTGFGHWSTRAAELPSASIDSPFAVIGYEWGWMGAAVLAASFAGVVGIAAWTAVTTRGPFFRALATAIGAWWASALVLSLGGSLGLVPLTTSALPLLTPGGASTLASLASLGILGHVLTRMPARDDAAT